MVEWQTKSEKTISGGKRHTLKDVQRKKLGEAE